ncbi:uncharacterized protein LOC108719101 isoform X3 [Xenopus laevis]|uniref:Uncharacterized protein LOC108719101 isoform X3 n=1 Tax=Xenopus laevis TaxID=8355 RepID=A0A8J1L0X6_XENLA|nr:uncharacterized protein LOC108719101 isoform X3 [Xenopus laevis]
MQLLQLLLFFLLISMNSLLSQELDINTNEQDHLKMKTNIPIEVTTTTTLEPILKKELGIKSNKRYNLKMKTNAPIEVTTTTTLEPAATKDINTNEQEHLKMKTNIPIEVTMTTTLEPTFKKVGHFGKVVQRNYKKAQPRFLENKLKKQFEHLSEWYFNKQKNDEVTTTATPTTTLQTTLDPERMERRGRMRMEVETLFFVTLAFVVVAVILGVFVVTLFLIQRRKKHDEFMKYMLQMY